MNASTSTCATFFGLLVLATAVMGHAQSRPAAKKEDPALKPRVVTLTTRDGLKLRAQYFPSDKGKAAIPVMLVHEWGGQGSPYVRLATSLRDAGCAVLITDYRGHGGSREQMDVRGNPVSLDPGAMRRLDAMAVINSDLEAAKSFLKDENDQGKLNLNALAVIGVREGALLAAHWTVADWRFPSLGAKKQGQDVKVLILVSPEKNFKGIAIDPTLRDISLIQLPTMIVAGSDSREASEAERIARQIESMKRRLLRGEAPRFVLLMPSTNLNGARLINDSREVIPAIVRFVTNEIKVSAEWNPWIERN